MGISLTAIHLALEEFYLWYLHRLALRLGQAIALVVCLSRVDRVDLNEHQSFN